MSQENHWNFFIKTDLSGYTLIIPSVAVGNVGQLACDLLISSLNMKKIASVYSPAFIPILGYDPYDLNSTNLSSCCEVYQCMSKNIVVLQLRAPLVFKYARMLLNDVVIKFIENKIKDIIILTSSFAHEKKHISTSAFRYIANEVCPYRSNLQNMKWQEHDSIEARLKIHGGGFASLLYEICTDKSLPCVVLYKYCSEGDNIPDAYEMVQHLSRIVPLFSEKQELLTQLVQPVSWKLLFGRPPPQDIY